MFLSVSQAARHIPLLLTAMLVLAGCAGQSFQVKDLAKNDIDMAADHYRHETQQIVKRLMVKLYKRNPRELEKQRHHRTLDARLAQLAQDSPLLFDELQGRRSIDALSFAIDPAFTGDRVFALTVGLASMLNEAYGYTDDFYVYHQLDAQKLYNSARNIEVLRWRLRNALDDRGNPLLYTNSHQTGAINISFDRLLTTLIAHQDMLSRIVADQNQRTINTVTRSVISMVFIPL